MSGEAVSIRDTTSIYESRLNPTPRLQCEPCLDLESINANPLEDAVHLQVDLDSAWPIRQSFEGLKKYRISTRSVL